MKKGGVILNFARAGIVDDAAVVAALDAGRLHAYVCDFPNDAAQGSSEGGHAAAPRRLDRRGRGELRRHGGRPACATSSRTATSATASISRKRCCRARPAPRASPSPTATCRTWSARSRPASPSASINIADLLNKSRGEYAYTLIDVDGAVGEDLLRQDPRASTACCRRGSSEACGPMARRRPRTRARRGREGRRPPPAPRSKRCARRSTAVDEQIHGLINERARLAQQVGISKSRDGHTVDFYRPEREAQVLRMARERNNGPLRDEEVLRLFREIMSACLAQQEPLKVAFLGPEGTFTQTAVLSISAIRCARCRWPRSTRCSTRWRPAARTSAWCRSRTPPKARSTTRSTGSSTSPLKICGEVELRIHHYLMGDDELRWAASSASARIRSRWRSAAAWLDEHLPERRAGAGVEQRRRRAARAR